MVEEEPIVKSARLSPEENKVLEDSGLSFADIVRDAIKKTEKKNKVLSRKQRLNKLIANGVYTIIGLSLLSVLNLSSNIITILIIGGLGSFFTVIGGINLYLTIKEVNIYGK